LDLAPYIRELVLLNECIILPDFGGFETQYVPSRYDAVQQRMLPPTKKVRFVSEYTSGGDVLKEHLVKRLKIKPEQAKKFITDYVSDIQTRLSKYETVKIENVGIFKTETNSKLSFTPFEEENYLADAYGLEPLSVSKPVQQESHAKSKLSVASVRPRNNTLTFVIVGIILISILFTITVLISTKFDLPLFDVSDNSKSDDLIIIGGNSKKDTLLEKIDQQLTKTTSVKHALHYSVPDKTPSTNDKRYALIAGSFKNFKKADKFKLKLETLGFNAEIIETSNLYRVSVANFTNKNEAYQEMYRINKQLEMHIWLLTLSNN